MDTEDIIVKPHHTHTHITDEKLRMGLGADQVIYFWEYGNITPRP